MTVEEPLPSHPSPGPPGLPDDPPPDVRVQAVSEVLSGRSTAEVAHRFHVPAAVLHRWVQAYRRAGGAAIAHRVDPDDDAERILAAFAHEVRVPVLVAGGWAAMLREGAIQPDRIGPTLDRICEALDTLAERTFDVELLSRAATGGLTLQLEPVTVDELTVELPGLVHVGGEGGAVRLPVDERYFPRILRDLWRAARRPPTAPDVRVEVQTVLPWIEIRVIRSGPPIDPIVLRSLFDPLGAAEDHSRIRIGLYLARVLAVAHGGTIGARQDDSGTVLWVRVPRHFSPTTPHHDGVTPAPGAPS